MTILVFDDVERVLLVRHSSGGTWVAPGGMVEPDEGPADAARREMMEETGCAVELTRILGVHGGPDCRVVYENGDEVGYVMTVYEARVLDGLPRPNGSETLDVGYFRPDEVDRLNTAKWLPPVLREAVRQREQRSHGA